MDVILPCLNEEAALPWVLGRMPDGYHPIVVDNASSDRTAEIARDLGAEVVSEPRRGFGAACHAGLLAARADLVCFMDADASLDPRQLPAVSSAVAHGEADLVLGARRPVASGAWPWHARLGNRLLARRLRRRTGADLHDLGPMRAARREALVELGLTDRRFGYPLEMVLRAAAAGWRVAEVEVDYLPRSGRSKVTGTVRGTMRAISDMRRVMAEHSRTPVMGQEPPGSPRPPGP
ncbi:glycosyltransferase family 2 protein [Nonomuraea sp. NPDC059007]|uniref:glycosyltransferase family 2 protein n=1 Tax=Nonomuraea sp. NPDC059007 TaxID=3346692 RepID=UPI0036A60049